MRIQMLTRNRDIPGIRIDNLPKNGLQNLHINALERHKNFVTVEADKITFRTVDGNVVMNIIHQPGRFCLTCDERLPDFGGNGTLVEAQRASVCLAHVEAHGKSAEKSEKWPHGYSNRPNSFECSIEDQRNG